MSTSEGSIPERKKTKGNGPEVQTCLAYLNIRCL